MKVLVLGAGVTGITTAHYLAHDGHDVCVVDRQSGPAMEASAANAGAVAPGCALPWAAPGMRMRLMKSLLRGDPRLRVTLRFDPSLLRWLRAWSRQCNEAGFNINTMRMQRLALYSLHCLQALRRGAEIDYHHTTDGILQILRTDRELKIALKRLPLYEELGTPYTVLDPQACIAVDPALEFSWSRFAGGLYLPMDETGDCGAFTRALAERCAARGVRFLYDTQVEALLGEYGHLHGVTTGAGVLEADCYVLALAQGAPALLKPLGLRLPVQNICGHSVTLPLANAARAPRAGVMDMRSEIAITRLGELVRISGGMELGIKSGVMKGKTGADRSRRLLEAFNELYPYAADPSRPAYWRGGYLATPDGPPLLGATPYDNLLLNLGHGAQGWTMACGSARVISDLVAGRKPEIELNGLTLARFAGKGGGSAKLAR
jgi:D-amino-acid dehydrogenase